MTSSIDRFRDPALALDQWVQEARAAHSPMPEAVVLATATKSGKPSARVVLFKGWLDEPTARGTSAKGIFFVTNYDSRKSKELRSNPYASMVFYWGELGKQVRVEGRVHRTSRSTSEAYFAKRPRESQVGAWASRQSRPISSYDALKAQEAEVQKRFSGATVPCPSNWGGFVLVPASIEFWVNQVGRLHERVIYKKKGTAWHVQWLSP